MDLSEFVRPAHAGGYTALVLQRVGEGLCITAAADGASKDEVSGRLDMESRQPLANVQADERAARVLPLWAERLGSGHLVDLLKEAVQHCPERIRGTADIEVDGRRYTITRFRGGMRVQGEHADLTLEGDIVTRRNGQRWLYLRGLPRPPRDGGR